MYLKKVNSVGKTEAPEKSAGSIATFKIVGIFEASVSKELKCTNSLVKDLRRHLVGCKTSANFRMYCKCIDSNNNLLVMA